MKIVIDIPEEVYKFIKDRGHLPYAVSLANLIEDGIPYEEHPKGKWMYNPDWVNDEMQSEFYCSECKRGAYPTLDNYCPHCGADMRGEE